jgi:hypothetical protein
MVNGCFIRSQHGFQTKKQVLKTMPAGQGGRFIWWQ